MTKGKQLEIYKTKRQKIANDMRVLMKTPDSPTKFDKLIKLGKEYENITLAMNLEGFSAKVWPLNLGSQKWIEARNDYLKDKKAACKKVYNEIKSRETIQNNNYNIVLCWTIKPDYCVCESIVEKLQKYFTSIGLNTHDLTKTTFPDRVEFCETYRLNCSKDKYELILKSAEYILDISTESAYDKCNMGIFGKEL